MFPSLKKLAPQTFFSPDCSSEKFAPQRICSTQIIPRQKYLLLKVCFPFFSFENDIPLPPPPHTQKNAPLPNLLPKFCLKNKHNKIFASLKSTSIKIFGFLIFFSKKYIPPNHCSPIFPAPQIRSSNVHLNFSSLKIALHSKIFLPKTCYQIVFSPRFFPSEKCNCIQNFSSEKYHPQIYFYPF